MLAGHGCRQTPGMISRGRAGERSSGVRRERMYGRCREGAVGESSGTGIESGDTRPALPMRARVPTLGLDALALILLPSYAVHVKWIDAAVVSSIRSAVETSHAITGFICILIVGSMLGIDIRPLAKALPRLAVVILAASIAALLAGAAAGRTAGMEASGTLYLIVVPLMAGGLNAGVLPLALGYGNAFGNAVLATLLPPALLGNLAATILAGAVGYIGYTRRRLALADGRERPAAGSGRPASGRASPANLAAAILLLACVAVAAYGMERMTGVSEPIFLLALSGILLVTDALPRPLRLAVVAIYRFSAKILVFPVLVIVGLLYSPWSVLLGGFSIGNVLVVSATVAALGLAGYAGALWTGLDQTEGSLIAISRAALGGTGDIAMLSAARRLDLMPLAQIATRLGGAVTVFIALLTL
jgi:malate:Na+ symporter